MPRKQRKTKEEKLAEGFFPIDEDSLKRAIEKEEKKIDENQIIKIENSPKITKSKPTRKRKILPDSEKSEKPVKQKKTRKVSSRGQKTFSVPKIDLKQDGYELIITEKPQAAMKIASALGKARKFNFQNIPYYELERDNRKIVVACAVGHLFTLKQNKFGQELPVFDISWVPNYMVRKKDFTKKYYDTISKLVKNAKSITVATDYDVEGEVIGLNVVKYICGQKDANRMKFSTLTDKELNKSYEEKSNHLNWGQAIAGETRHYLDWMYGINLSRALMNSLKSIGTFKVMSIGRVQGPTLKLIVEKEKQIESFKSEKYWQVFIKIKNSHEFELKHVKDISKKAELKKFDKLSGKNIDVKTTKTQQKISPNPPFNLTGLQTESYGLYGITPTRTLQIAQSLYLLGLISYPRTSSQKLPDSIGYNEILEKLSRKYKAEKLTTRDKPVEGSKTDPAHPSIYPTSQGNGDNLSDEERKILNLIERRFLALFCEDAIIEDKKISGEIDGLRFTASGQAIKKKNWMEIYPIKLKEKEIPDLNGNFKIISVRNEEKETQPPKRYSPASIISILEKKNLGTKATRSSILETLYDRDYIRERSIEATPLGMSLIETLEKHSPIIVEEKLTRNFEDEMMLIQNSSSGFEEKEKKVIEKAQESLKLIITQIKSHEQEIGKELLEANIDLTKQKKEENVLLLCPKCKKGNLAITYSKKSSRFFVACNAYPECKNTFSLPPNGLIKKSGKDCEVCKWPMLLRISKGRRPWEFCFNPECEKNKERVEKYKAENPEKFQ